MKTKKNLDICLRVGIVLTFLLFAKINFVKANQLNENNPRHKPQSEMPNVFWDCPFCDMDYVNYVKEEINYVNHVRDRNDADLHVMITREDAANGGTRYSFFFWGQKGFSNLNDTLRLNVGPDASEEITRGKILHALRSGLTPYLLKTSMWKNQSIEYNSLEADNTPVIDIWNNWIFAISADGDIDIEESQKNYEFGGEIKANKINENIKLELEFEVDYEREVFDVNTSNVISIHRTYEFDALWVRSLSQHWSTGGFTNFRSSKYDNLDQSYSIAPAVEFSFFPYKEANTSQLTILYRPEYIFNEYLDSTIFNKTQEHLARQILEVDYEIKRKWGTIDLSLDLLSYFHDFSKNHLSFRSYTDVNIVKGLSVYFYGRISLIHDQLSLRKGDATTEEILTKQQELATNFQYSTGIGLRYTFGAMSNNIVNARF